MEERKRIIISIHDLLRMIARNIPLIVLWSVLCAMLLYCYKDLYTKPVFTAETSIYVLSRTPDNDYGRLDVSDLDVSRQLTIDALSILNSEQIADEVLANLNGDAEELRTMTAGDLLNMVSISSRDDSLEITISVSGADPYIVCDIANTYRETAIRELNERLTASGIQTTKEAVIPLGPSGRSPSLYGAIGLFLGLMSSGCFILLFYIIRRADRNEEDVREV